MGKLTAIDIDDLHPTQLTLGMDEVRERTRKISQLAAPQLDALREEKAVPHVIGPDKRIYMVDHHHFCRVMHDLGQGTVLLGETLADWSGLSLEKFWRKMEKSNRCWPIDIDGNRRPCIKIPAHIKDLTDNPWRTLARHVRGDAYRVKEKVGGKDQGKVNFLEFQWGNYYRSFMTTRLLETDIRLAEELAVKVSSFDEARDLPGYRGPK